MKEFPSVSIAVVALNAAAFLPTLFLQIQAQTYPLSRIELVLVDSASADHTLALMRDYAAGADHPVQVLRNPQGSLPAGCNVALRAYRGECFLRLDAHCEIPPDFIEQNVREIQRGHDIVGGFVGVAPAKSDWGAVLSALDASRFCGGVARFRNPGRARHVDTLAFAMYRRCVYEKVGLYDERLKRTEDNDMVYRMRQAGFGFYYSPQIHCTRFPRDTLSGMLRQKWENGFWIGRTLRIQPRCFTLRHFAPGCFVLALCLFAVLSLLGMPAPLLFLLATYLLLDLGFTVDAARKLTRGRGLALLSLPWCFPLMHIAYGLGTLRGMVGASGLRALPAQRPIPEEGEGCP